MELNTCIEAEDGDPDAINFVARTESNNGVSARVKPVEGKEPQPAGLITCAGGGSVLSTFFARRTILQRSRFIFAYSITAYE